MSTVKRSPAENHAAALSDYRDHLNGARGHAGEAWIKALDVVRAMKAILDGLPEHAAVVDLPETELLAATEGKLPDLDRLDGDAEDLAAGLTAHVQHLIVAVEEAGHLRRYLTAGDFED